MAVPEEDGREMARDVAVTEGLFAGTSTGLNLAAAKRVAANRSTDDAVVTIAVDTGIKYLTDDLYRQDSTAPSEG